MPADNGVANGQSVTVIFTQASSAHGGATGTGNTVTQMVLVLHAVLHLKMDLSRQVFQLERCWWRNWCCINCDTISREE